MIESASMSPASAEVPVSDPTNTAIIRPIANDAELTLVHRLTHDCYVSQGYARPQPNGRLTHYADFDGLPQTTVIVAICQDEVVGSVSLTVDGPWGLTVDNDFKKVCDSLRYEGRSLAVIWRLVMKPSLKSSRRILMDLFKETADFAMRQGANSGLVTVNPRHKSVYQRLFNATEVSIKNTTKGLNDAPAVLLRADFEKFPEFWKTLVESSPLRRAA